MNLVFALAAAVLFGSGSFLLLKRDLVRVVAGMVLVSQSAVLCLIASGLERGAAPIYPLPEGPVSDPLVQSMALTAIVIGLAVTALLLVIVHRVAVAFFRARFDEIAEAEAARDLELERESLYEREREEGAVP